MSAAETTAAEAKAKLNILDNTMCLIMSRSGEMVPCYKRYCVFYEVQDDLCLIRLFLLGKNPAVP